MDREQMISITIKEYKKLSMYEVMIYEVREMFQSKIALDHYSVSDKFAQIVLDTITIHEEVI